MSYVEKFNTNIEKTNYKNLDEKTKEFIKNIALKYQFSFQELKQLIDFSIDFKMWHEAEIYKVFEDEYANKKQAFNHIRKIWEDLKSKSKLI